MNQIKLQLSNYISSKFIIDMQILNTQKNLNFKIDRKSFLFVS